MRKAGLSIALFLAAFILTYVGSCYLVPGWRIKLAADGLTYFLESLKVLVPVKLLVSFCVGLLAALIPAIVQRMKANKAG